MYLDSREDVAKKLARILSEFPLLSGNRQPLEYLGQCWLAIQRAHPQLNNNAEVAGYLRRVVRNLWYDDLRKEARHQKLLVCYARCSREHYDFVAQDGDLLLAAR
jgi:DNA-directed RNA polymerase specialized sigma24 family protein